MSAVCGSVCAGSVLLAAAADTSSRPLLLQVKTNRAEEIIALFIDFESGDRRLEGLAYNVSCCSGISIDLLNAVARDLQFDYSLYLVADGLFGVPRNGQWDGITADLVSGAAHLAFTAFSVTSSRIEVSPLQLKCI